MSHGIRFIDLRKIYPGRIVALAGIDLVCPSAKTTALVGPSGSGKSTILKIVAGLLEASGGRVLFGSRDVTNLAPEARNVGLVFQSYALFPNMTVQQNVEFGLRVRKINSVERQRRALEALKTVHMGELAHRRIYQLSVGQQQRVALARAVVFQPDILLLDEPLSALDPQIRQELRNELARLLRQFGITTIYVTHDQQEAMSLGDQIVVINRGRVEQIGTPADVYARPANEFVANFMGNANIFDAEIQYGGTGRVLIRLGCGTILMSEHDFHRRWPDVKRGRIRAMVRPQDISIVTSSEAQMHFHAKEVLYLGDRLRIRGQTEAGGTLDIETYANRSRVSLGDRLSICVDPEDIHFFAADW